MGEMLYQGKVKQVWSTDDDDVYDDAATADQNLSPPTPQYNVRTYGLLRVLKLL